MFWEWHEEQGAEIPTKDREGNTAFMWAAIVGNPGIFAIPEMGRFYRHVLIEGNFPHHGAVAFGHYGKTLYEVFKYIGVPVEEIGYNHPAGQLYKTEIPFN